MVYTIIFILQIILLYFLSRRLTKNIYKILHRFTKNKKATVFLYALLFFPGTFVHEMAHFLFALFLLVPIGDVKLIPEIEESGVKLGSISIGKTDFVRRFLVGVAPLIVGTTLILFGLNYLIGAEFFDSFWAIVVGAYIVFEIGNTMFMSKRDIVGTWRFLVFLLIISVVYFVLGMQNYIDISVSLPEKFVILVKNATVFMLVPIVIDIILFFLVKFVEDPKYIISDVKNSIKSSQ